MTIGGRAVFSDMAVTGSVEFYVKASAPGYGSVCGNSDWVDPAFPITPEVITVSGGSSSEFASSNLFFETIGVSDDGHISAFASDDYNTYFLACLDQNLALTHVNPILAPAGENGTIQGAKLSRARTTGETILVIRYLDLGGSFSNYYFERYDTNCALDGTPYLIPHLESTDTYFDLDTDVVGRSAVSAIANDGFLHLFTFDGTGTPLDEFTLTTENALGNHVKMHPSNGQGVVTSQGSGAVEYRRFDLSVRKLMDSDPGTCTGSPPEPPTCLTDTSGMMNYTDVDNSWNDTQEIGINSNNEFVIINVGAATGVMRALFFDSNAQFVAGKDMGWPDDNSLYDTFHGMNVTIQTMGNDFLIPWYRKNKLDRLTRYSADGTRRGTDVTASLGRTQNLFLDGLNNTYQFYQNRILKNTVTLPGTAPAPDPQRNITIAINGNAVNGSTSNIQIGYFLIGETVPAKTLAITNNGASSVSLTDIVVPSGILISPPLTGVSIGAGQTFSTTVSFSTAVEAYPYGDIKFRIPGDYYEFYTSTAYGQILDPAHISLDNITDWDVDNAGNTYAVGSKYRYEGHTVQIQCRQAGSYNQVVKMIDSVPYDQTGSRLVNGFKIVTDRISGRSILLYYKYNTGTPANDGYYVATFDSNCNQLGTSHTLGVAAGSQYVDIAANPAGGFGVFTTNLAGTQVIVQPIDNMGNWGTPLSAVAPLTVHSLKGDFSPDGNVGIVSVQSSSGGNPQIRRLAGNMSSWSDGAFFAIAAPNGGAYSHHASIQNDGSFVELVGDNFDSKAYARFYDASKTFIIAKEIGDFPNNPGTMTNVYGQAQWRITKISGNYYIPTFNDPTNAYAYGYNFIYASMTITKYGPTGSNPASSNLPINQPPAAYYRINDVGDNYMYAYPYSPATKNAFTTP